MTSISKNVYFNKLHDTVNKYNKTYYNQNEAWGCRAKHIY